MSVDGKFADELDNEWEINLNTCFFFIKESFPSVLSICIECAFNVVNLYYITLYNNEILIAAYGLGISIFRGFVIGLIISISISMSIFINHSLGARNYSEAGYNLQKGQILMIIIIFIFFCIFSQSEKIFKLIRIKPNVAHQAQIYINYSSIWAISSVFFESTRFYLYCFNKFNIILYIQICTLISHICFGYFIVYKSSNPLRGSAINMGISNFLCYLILYMYIKKKKIGEKSFFPYTKDCLPKFSNFSLKILSSAFSSQIKWIGLESTTILVGLLNSTDKIAAHTTVLNFLLFFQMCVIGVVITINSYLPKYIGEGRVNLVIKFLKITSLIFSIILALLIIIGFFLKNFIAEIFCINDDMKYFFNIVFYFFLFFYLPFDSLQMVFANILRSFLNQDFLLIFSIIIFIGIGFSTSFTLSFYFNYDINGIWIGLSLSSVLASITFMMKFYSLDIHEKILEIRSINMKNTILLEDVEMKNL